jgi:outer membrane protein OmpA-like peptidoglycan-associated protein/outer membrane protein W
MIKRRNTTLLAAVAVPALLLASQAATAAAGDWDLRLGLGWSSPEGSTTSLPSGINVPGGVGTNAGLRTGNDGPVLFGDVTWHFTEHLAAEFWMNANFDSDIDLKGDAGQVSLGRYDYTSPMVNLQWHFMPDSTFRPYIGGGVHYTLVSNTDSRLSIDDEFGWTLGGGVDIGNPRRGWFANLFVKYLDASANAKLTAGTGPGISLPIFPPQPTTPNLAQYPGQFNLSSWYYGIGVGYKFGQKEAAYVAPVAAVAAPVAAAPRGPVDADGDGVADGLDQCPNTPRGDRVGPAGCSCDVSIQLAFEFDSATLTAADKAELDRVATRLQQLKFVGGEAGGHTDSTGDDAYNLDLSKRRAQAAVDYLATKGVASTRVTVVGYGEAAPVADNATAEGRAMNRRVVLRRTDCGPAPR